MPKGMHNPLPASLGSECKKATQILDSFINGSWRGSPGRELPERILREAKGVAILTVTKAGILGSVRFGSGILIARLPDAEPEPSTTENTDPEAAAPTASRARWSPPSAISTFGLGFGGQAGFELTDFVFIFNSVSSLETFSKLGSLTIAGNFSIAFGPLGRNAEIAGGVSSNGVGGMMSFAKTKGLFGGVSFESGVLVERRWANRRFYGKKATARGILKGEVEVTENEEGTKGVNRLMKVLGEVFDMETSGAIVTPVQGDAVLHEPESTPSRPEETAVPSSSQPTGPAAEQEQEAAAEIETGADSANMCTTCTEPTVPVESTKASQPQTHQ
ncbi:hypothetical protein BDV18DRAFT_134321 [Aspergillus unguis]